MNLEQQMVDNEQMKNQQNSIFAVAAAKAGFKRKKVKVNKMLSWSISHKYVLGWQRNPNETS